MTPELASLNHHAWYASIFRAHGILLRANEHYWTTDAEPPPYYSHLVTRTRGAAAREAQLRRLSELAARAGGRSWGFKDSFDELPSVELESLGLRPLFQASWYGWAADGPRPKPETSLVAQRVASAEALVFQLEGSGIDAGVFVRECARYSRALHAGRALVGYGSEVVLRSLMSLGFAALGPLRVWVS